MKAELCLVPDLDDYSNMGPIEKKELGGTFWSLLWLTRVLFSDVAALYSAFLCFACHLLAPSSLT